MVASQIYFYRVGLDREYGLFIGGVMSCFYRDILIKVDLNLRSLA